MTVFGWDASDFDWDRGPMDLAAAYRDGIRLFTHKITESTNVVHEHCGTALDRARAAGIPVLGGYMVVRTPGPSIAAQVAFMLKTLDRYAPWWRTFPAWVFQVDLEKWPYDAVAATYGVQACNELARQAPGRFHILYASRGQYGSTIPGGDPLWNAAYGTNPVGQYRAVYDATVGDNSARWNPYSNRAPVILQYGSRLKIGTQNTCDANAFRGSLAELLALVTSTQLEDEMEIGTDVPVPPGMADVSTRTSIDVGELLMLTFAHAVRAKRQTDAIMAETAGEDAVILTPEQLDALGDDIASQLVVAPDNGLTEADLAAVGGAVKRALREGTGLTT
jgi:hypothetical protein